MMKSELKRFGRGFIYAYNGIRLAIQEERNVRFHLCAAVYAYLAAWLAGLNQSDIALLSLAIFCVDSGRTDELCGGTRRGQAGYQPLVERRRGQGHGGPVLY